MLPAPQKVSVIKGLGGVCHYFSIKMNISGGFLS
nr:MAG TPA: hypothetical protein [Caudoviricetes sp.]